MQVHQGLEDLPAFKHTVLSIGMYDGVHIGHQFIIHRLRDMAAKHGGESVLMTFHPHPRLVLHPDDNSLKLITTIEEKAELLEKMGLDHLVIVPFTEALSQMEAEDYIRELLVHYFHPRVLVIGYDHRYGKGRRGDIHLLREMGNELGYEVDEIPAQTVDDITVSSTKVRQALLEGDIATANEFLAYPFTLSGTVIHGEKVGRSLGYPTANLHIDNPYKLVPPNGIYAVWVEVDGARYMGALSIGYRPTFTSEKKRCIEVYILHFDGNLYGKTITLTFAARIRDEKKFDSKDALIARMATDVVEAEHLLASSAK